MQGIRQVTGAEASRHRNCAVRGPSDPANPGSGGGVGVVMELGRLIRVCCAVAVSVLAGSCRSPSDDTRNVTTTAPAEIPPAVFTPVADSLLLASEAAGEGWVVFGGTYANQRYSELGQVNRENVDRLVPAWIHQTGIAESFQSSPIVVGNVMYVTTAESQVVALHAATGELLWRFTPHLGSTVICCGPNNRGVAVYGNSVFVGTLDAKLIALDHQTGEVRWETSVADSEDGYSITMAPLAYDGRVVIGVAGGKYGIRGFVAAYDAETGEEAWRWYTIPAPDENETGWWGQWRDADPYGTSLDRDLLKEREDSARYVDAWRRGGGPVWMTPAYDPASGTIYVSVGNPSPPLDGVVRPGDNLYTGSIVALDGRTGELRWYFQYLPHDVWDLSPGSAPFLFTLDGRRLVGHAGKTGWLYVVDAATGQPVLRSDNFVPQENLFTRPTEDGTRMAPGANGGASWSPVAYSPRTGFAYVPATHQPMIFTRAFQPKEPGRLWLGGSFILDPDESAWGVFSAIDVRTGEIVWQRQSPAPLAGAALVTAGDVVFVGQGSGTLDAFDATDGTLLWQFQAGAGVHGGPVTYQIDGVQYIAIAAGGNYQSDSPRGNAVIAFTLFDHLRRSAPKQYAAPQYPRTGAIRHGAVRQVPAASLENPGATGSMVRPDGEGTR